MKTSMLLLSCDKRLHSLVIDCFDVIVETCDWNPNIHGDETDESISHAPKGSYINV